MCGFDREGEILSNGRESKSRWVVRSSQVKVSHGQVKISQSRPSQSESAWSHQPPNGQFGLSNENLTRLRRFPSLTCFLMPKTNLYWTKRKFCAQSAKSIRGRIQPDGIVISVNLGVGPGGRNLRAKAAGRHWIIPPPTLPARWVISKLFGNNFTFGTFHFFWRHTRATKFVLRRSPSFDVVFGAKNKSMLNKKKISHPIGQKHQGTHSARRKRDIGEFVGWTGRAKFTRESGGKAVNHAKRIMLRQRGELPQSYLGIISLSARSIFSGATLAQQILPLGFTRSSDDFSKSKIFGFENLSCSYRSWKFINWNCNQLRNHFSKLKTF